MWLLIDSRTGIAAKTADFLVCEILPKRSDGKQKRFQIDGEGNLFFPGPKEEIHMGKLLLITDRPPSATQINEVTDIADTRFVVIPAIPESEISANWIS